MQVQEAAQGHQAEARWQHLTSKGEASPENWAAGKCGQEITFQSCGGAQREVAGQSPLVRVTWLLQ